MFDIEHITGLLHEYYEQRNTRYIMNTSIVPMTPAETLKISPENLEISNCYLTCQNIQETAERLRIPIDHVTGVLAKTEVKAYIDAVFLDLGYNNRHRMRNLLDAVINKKLEEMEESDTGSNKDITDILALSHKMTMDIMNAQIKLEEAKAKSAPQIKNQTNVQINSDGGPNYQSLLDKLLNKPKTIVT